MEIGFIVSCVSAKEAWSHCLPWIDSFSPAANYYTTRTAAMARADELARTGRLALIYEGVGARMVRPKPVEVVEVEIERVED